MFPFQKSDDLCFRNPYDQNQQPETQQDPIVSLLVSEKIQRKTRSVVREKNDEISKNIKQKAKKQITHKEIERRRRKEMSDLFVSLRSLLPLEFIKGKRSKSDHMHAAVNYIKKLEENIEELKIKRDKLNKSSDDSHSMSKGSSNKCLPSVTVSLCQGGLEVLISSSCGEDGVSLSRVLRVLNEEGLNIISFVSNQVNEMLLSSIRCEVSDMVFDLSLLQQKLINVLVS